MNKVNFSKDDILKEIYPYIKGKEVLDIGCVEHDIKNKNKARIWVHDFLREHAREVIGIDIEKKSIEQLRKQGYDVYYKNAETFKFNKKFDVIFAGELIEHLGNPGLFLGRCKKHLRKGGLLILTTPNAFCLRRVFEIIFSYTNNPIVNDEHTVWFSPKVIKQILHRYSFNIQNIIFFDYPLKNPLMIHKIIGLFCNLFGNKFTNTMIIFAK